MMTQITQMVIDEPSKVVFESIPAVLLDNLTKATVDFYEKTCGDTSILDKTVTDCRSWTKIVGIISFVGDLTWSIVLVLPEFTAEDMSKRFAGFEVPFDSEDMGDVVGEMVNIIAGMVCGNLEKDCIKAQLSLPTVARGKDFEHLVPETFITHRLYFQNNGNDFWIKVFMAKDSH
jgi:chemotaxis protein CheX